MSTLMIQDAITNTVMSRLLMEMRDLPMRIARIVNTITSMKKSTNMVPIAITNMNQR